VGQRRRDPGPAVGRDRLAGIPWESPSCVPLGCVEGNVQSADSSARVLNLSVEVVNCLIGCRTPRLRRCTSLRLPLDALGPNLAPASRAIGILIGEGTIPTALAARSAATPAKRVSSPTTPRGPAPATLKSRCGARRGRRWRLTFHWGEQPALGRQIANATLGPLIGIVQEGRAPQRAPQAGGLEDDFMVQLTAGNWADGRGDGSEVRTRSAPARLVRYGRGIVALLGAHEVRVWPPPAVPTRRAGS